MLNVYGEPDDLLVMEAEDGGHPYIVVVDFKTGSSGNPKYDNETNYHAAYRVQLEFYGSWNKSLPVTTFRIESIAAAFTST